MSPCLSPSTSIMAWCFLFFVVPSMKDITSLFLYILKIFCWIFLKSRLTVCLVLKLYVALKTTTDPNICFELAIKFFDVSWGFLMRNSNFSAHFGSLRAVMFVMLFTVKVVAKITKVKIILAVKKDFNITYLAHLVFVEMTVTYMPYILRC